MTVGVLMMSGLFVGDTFVKGREDDDDADERESTVLAGVLIVRSLLAIFSGETGRGAACSK